MLEGYLPAKILAYLSLGWELHLRCGLGSGEWFEYAFQKTIHGRGVFGRWLDRRLLESPHWRGLRAVAKEAMAFARGLLSHRQRLGLPTHILDLSPGTAPYLRDLLHGVGNSKLEAICLRRDPRLLAFGRSLAYRAGLTNLWFQAGDALDPPSYLGRAPDLILCLDAAPVCGSRDEQRLLLELWRQHLRPGGACLIGIVPGAESTPHRQQLRQSPFTLPGTWRAALEEQGFSGVADKRVLPFAVLLQGWHLPGEQSQPEGTAW